MIVVNGKQISLSDSVIDRNIDLLGDTLADCIIYNLYKISCDKERIVKNEKY